MITIYEANYVLQNLIESIEQLTADDEKEPVIVSQLEDIRHCINYLRNGIWLFGADDGDVRSLYTAVFDPGEKWEPEHSIFKTEEEWNEASLRYKRHCRLCKSIIETYDIKNYLKLMEECGD